MGNLRDSNVAEARSEAEAAKAAIAAKTLAPFKIAQAESSVRETLRDPENGRFRNVRRNTATGAVCGFVNGKNAYGGYVGEPPFIYYQSAKQHSPQVLTGSNIADVATFPYIAAFCPQDGTTVSTDAPSPAARARRRSS